MTWVIDLPPYHEMPNPNKKKGRRHAEDFMYTWTEWTTIWQNLAEMEGLQELSVEMITSCENWHTWTLVENEALKPARRSGLHASSSLYYPGLRILTIQSKVDCVAR